MPASTQKSALRGEINTAAAASSQQQAQQQSQGSSSSQLNAAPSAAAAAATTSDDRKSPSVATAQDNHPYARGAVIEVWHIPKKMQGDDQQQQEEEDDWWSSEESSEEEEEKEQQKQQQRAVLLCDIIDRASHGKNSWRYYVHYKGLNRRMDEWIGLSRIVSPPSIGNAKARALKRQEEKDRKRKIREQLEKEEAEKQPLPRSGRRRSAVPFREQERSDTPTATTASRKARLTRRRSSVLNDADDGGSAGEDDDPLNASMGSTSSGGVLVGSSGVSGGDGEDGGGAPNQAQQQQQQQPNKSKSEIVTADVTTTTVGEHTVATVKAVELDEHEGLDEASLREHEEVTKIKNVGFLQLGRHQMETWYFSPLPKELIQGHNNSGSSSNSNAATMTPGGIQNAPTNAFLEVLYVCEFTFRLFARKEELQRFQRRIEPADRHPPGNEIYRNGNLSMFEIDGLEEKIYCQNLCYIAKLFLDHKTLYYDVDPFLFYVLCEVDDRGFHPVGYYSKEKYSDVGYNLACILSFPAHQRKGYGRFLIAFSYELTKKEEKVGSPEKPMSDLGQQAYKPYWASTIIDFLLHQSHESALSIMDIAKRTSIVSEDIVYTLNQLGILKIINGVYFIAAERSLLEKLAKKYPVKEPRVDPSKLHWTPFLTDVKRDKFSIHSKKSSLEAQGTSTHGSTSSAGN